MNQRILTGFRCASAVVAAESNDKAAPVSGLLHNRTIDLQSLTARISN
jgi:hypothetical protein